jgi:hypothetical protein
MQLDIWTTVPTLDSKEILKHKQHKTPNHNETKRLTVVSFKEYSQAHESFAI